MAKVGPKPQTIEDIAENFDFNNIMHIDLLIERCRQNKVKEFHHPSGLKIILDTRATQAGHDDGSF